MDPSLVESKEEDDAPPPEKPRKPTAFRAPISSEDDNSEEEKPQKPPKHERKGNIFGNRISLRFWSSTGKRTGKNEILAAPGSSTGFEHLTIPFATEVKSEGLFPEKFFSYVIRLEHRSGAIVERSHRYSEFVSFHKEWKAEYPGVPIELPKKLMSPSDDEIARRCVELQQYLRRMLEITALIYYVAGFVGCYESELKADLQLESHSTRPEDLDNAASTLNTSRVIRPRVKIVDAVSEIPPALSPKKQLPPLPLELDERPPNGAIRVEAVGGQPDLSLGISSSTRNEEKVSENVYSKVNPPPEMENDVKEAEADKSRSTANNSVMKAPGASLSSVPSPTARSSTFKHSAPAATTSVGTTRTLQTEVVLPLQPKNGGTAASNLVTKSLVKANTKGQQAVASPTIAKSPGVSVKERMALFERK